MARDFNFIIRPVITEKATSGQAQGKYQFFVRKDATKIEVKSAFKKLYGVDAVRVNVIHSAGKTRTGRTRLPVTKKHDMKKVIVTTKGKKSIDAIKPSLK